MKSVKMDYKKNIICKQLGIKYPIIGAPMFLCSNIELVAAVSNAGGLGCFPALNYRKAEELGNDIDRLRTLTSKPFGVNIITNSAAREYSEKFFQKCLDKNVKVYITSLGSPEWVIERAHQHGAFVWCDVTTLEYARKVQTLGADAVVAVTSEAGGHAGPYAPEEFIPLLKKNLHIPVLQAGGIADKKTMLKAFSYGADAVYMGTRFIASVECNATTEYKQAIVNAHAKDIVMTDVLSGTPCAVINTEYMQRIGTQLHFPWKQMMNSRWRFLKRMARLYLAWKGMGMLRNAEINPYKKIWAAGKTVEFIDSIKPVKQIIDEMVK